MDPIKRSTCPFCQGDLGVMGLSLMPMALRRLRKTAPSSVFRKVGTGFRKKHAPKAKSSAVVVADEPRASFVPGKGFRDLMGQPRSRWVFGHFDVENLAPVKAEDDKRVETLKGQGLHGEEIDRADGLRMGAEEGRTSASTATPLDNPLDVVHDMFLHERAALHHQ
jgi:hypothetical protein